MKKKLISALFAAVIAIIAAICFTACYDPYPRDYTKNDGVLSYSGGTVVGCVDENATEIIIPDSVTYYNTIGETVEETEFNVDEIAEEAFRGHKKLERIVIPATVTEIPSGVFAGCSNLKSIEISPQNTVYHGAGNCVIETANKTVVAGCNSSVIPADGTVTEIGERAFAGCTLNNFKIADTVTEIGERAFSSCQFFGLTLSDDLTKLGAECFANSNLKNIFLPASVTEIENAFDGCTTLEEVDVAENSSRFSSGQGIIFNKDKSQIIYAPLGLTGEVTLPSSVEKLPAKIFADREKITKLTIPTEIKKIEEGALKGCASLQSLTTPFALVSTDYIDTDIPAAETDFNLFFNGAVPDTLETVVITRGEIASLAFVDSGKIKNIILEESVKKVGAGAFEDCKSLKTVEVKGAAYIGHFAFYGCTGLTSVFFNDDVTVNTSGIFYDCGGLYELTLSAKTAEVLSGPNKDGITTRKLTITSGEIGYYKFRFCNIRELYIGDGVTVIRNGAFSDCRNLEKVDLGHGVTEIGSFAFPSVGEHALEYNAYDNAYYLGNADNPYYFLAEKTDKNITSCQIHPQTKIIGESAFNYCERLAGVTVPNGVITISYRAFYNCKSIEKIILPDSVKTIGEYAFGNCDKLKYFFIPSGVTRIDEFCPHPPYCQVFYEGTKEQLKSIYAGNPVESDLPIWVNIYYYSSEKPTEEGLFWHYVNDEITVWAE